MEQLTPEERAFDIGHKHGSASWFGESQPGYTMTSLLRDTGLTDMDHEIAQAAYKRGYEVGFKAARLEDELSLGPN